MIFICRPLKNYQRRLKFFLSYQLDFSENEYFENNIKVNIFSLQKNVEKILKPGE